MGLIKHGLANKHPLYSKWKRIRTRCYNTNCADYKYYGGRGITMCKEWDSFKQFYDDNISEWNKCSERYKDELLTTERINPEIGYTNGNITFIPNRLQPKNRRYNFLVDVRASGLVIERGILLKDFCAKNNLKYGTIRYHARIKNIFHHSGYQFNVRKRG